MLVVGQKYVLHLLGAMDQVHAIEMTLSDANGPLGSCVAGFI